MPGTYKEQIVDKMVDHVCSFVEPDKLDFSLKRKFQQILDNPERATESLYFLTEMAFKLTGKRAYLLIDEYDKLMMEHFNTDKYDEMRMFETALLSSALKGNQYLEKALLTGVMRISHESMFSGLNNIVTFDVFNDSMYTDDYGLTECEIDELRHLADFDKNAVRSWYNGIRIDGHAIYNIYSVMSFLAFNRYDCFWGKSGTLDMITSLLNDERKLEITKLLNDEVVELEMDGRISLIRLVGDTGSEAFYSLLVQTGYLALIENKLNKGTALVSIPNRELMIVWKNFIFNSLYDRAANVRTLFDNTHNLSLFAQDVEYFLCDRLSYHDLSVYDGRSKERIYERVYHVLLLGLLSAYEDVRFKYALSNRESGDGRYDVLVEKADANYIFEVKSCRTDDDLELQATKALKQIDIKRYGTDLESGGRRLVKIGVAVCGKLCKVRCA